MIPADPSSFSTWKYLEHRKEHGFWNFLPLMPSWLIPTDQLLRSENDINTMCLNRYYNVSNMYVYIYIYIYIRSYYTMFYLFIYLCKYSPLMCLFAYTCLVSLNFHVLYICDTSPIYSATFEAPWWALGWRLRIREPQRLARAPWGSPGGIFLGPWVVHHEKNMEETSMISSFFFGGWSQISRVLVVFWVVENDSVLWCRWSVHNFTFSSFLRRFEPDSGHVIQDGLAV